MRRQKVATTLVRRYLDAICLLGSGRRIDVDTTLFRRHMPTGQRWSQILLPLTKNNVVLIWASTWDLVRICEKVSWLSDKWVHWWGAHMRWLIWTIYCSSRLIRNTISICRFCKNRVICISIESLGIWLQEFMFWPQGFNTFSCSTQLSMKFQLFKA